MNNNNLKVKISWSFYDWANSAWSAIIITFIFSRYFVDVLATNQDKGTLYWTWTIGLSSLVAAFLSPIFGSISDQSQRSKISLEYTTLIYAFIATTLGGTLLIPISKPFITFSLVHLQLIILCAIIACFSYFMLVLATRKGDVSVISPFRYTRLIFALILAVFILKENPDFVTISGAIIIVLSGCYNFWREYRLKNEIT